jgi:hypothetical protein
VAPISGPVALALSVRQLQEAVAGPEMQPEVAPLSLTVAL